jgi:hypothetical protein
MKPIESINEGRITPNIVIYMRIKPKIVKIRPTTPKMRFLNILLSKYKLSIIPE